MDSPSAVLNCMRHFTRMFMLHTWSLFVFTAFYVFQCLSYFCNMMSRYSYNQMGNFKNKSLSIGEYRV